MRFTSWVSVASSVLIVTVRGRCLLKLAEAGEMDVGSGLVERLGVAADLSPSCLAARWLASCALSCSMVLLVDGPLFPPPIINTLKKGSEKMAM